MLALSAKETAFQQAVFVAQEPLMITSILCARNARFHVKNVLAMPLIVLVALVIEF